VRVKDIVKEKRCTSFREVADRLVEELGVQG